MSKYVSGSFRCIGQRHDLPSYRHEGLHVVDAVDAARLFDTAHRADVARARDEELRNGSAMRRSDGALILQGGIRKGDAEGAIVKVDAARKFGDVRVEPSAESSRRFEEPAAVWSQRDL
jgi:hypothetical protein